MHAIQFVNELAAKIGRDAKSIRVVDRALAEAGLRQTSAGRKFPDVTIEEAVYLLLALLSGFPATRAAEGASKLSKFRLGSGHQQKPETLAKALKISTSRLGKLTLLEVVSLLCIYLARGSIDPNTHAFRLEVSDGELACVEVVDLSGRASSAEVYFRDYDPISIGEGFSESRSANSVLFQWIGQKAAIPE